MKKFLYFFTAMLFVASATEKKKIENDKYRRNSLTTFFITDFGRLDRSVMQSVDFACQNYAVSLKFDSHDLGVDRTIQIRNIELKGKNKPKQSTNTITLIDSKYHKYRRNWIDKRQNKFQIITFNIGQNTSHNNQI